MSDMKQTTPARRVFWRQRRFWTMAAALSVLGAVAVAVPAAMAHRGFGGHGGHGFAHDPEKARERAAFAVEWAFRAVDATEQQQDEGRVVVERIVDELIPLGESHRAHRQGIARELVKPHIGTFAPISEATLRRHTRAPSRASRTFRIPVAPNV